MSLLEINIGGYANDGTGDDLREAFNKVNLNFQELDLRDDESTTASNMGAIGEGIFAKKLNYDLQFKKLFAGPGINLTANDERITIEAESNVKSLLMLSDSGSHKLTEVAAFNVTGGSGILTSITGNVLTIASTFTALEQDTTPRLGTHLDAQGYNIATVGVIDANMFNGTHTGNLLAQDGTIIVNHQTKSINLGLDGLNNVDFTTPPVAGDGLIYDGTNWKPSPVTPDSGLNFGNIIAQSFDEIEQQAKVYDMGSFAVDTVSIDLGTIV
jgi:hypothetical protein